MEYKNLAETTREDYRELGLKAGLEIHQQLLTSKKLFCRCPVVKPYSDKYNAEILRHMRPTLSELGEYDGTALMEFKTKKEIIYQINSDTVCTYEMDDTPPFELNEEALDIAIEIAILLNCNLVSEIHISRKQYLDGSIPTGFQRTTILGINGWIPYNRRKIRIVQLGLEEDACREVSDVGHTRVYRTDRLGIPLIETVTYPDIRTPHEAFDVAQIIRRLTRSTGKVMTGIGSARQDVNVSIKGGTRIEIKGVPRIPLIPALIHNEAFRQLSLLKIREELRRRGIKPSNFRYQVFDVSSLLKGTKYYPVARAIKNGSHVRAVLLKGYRGILSMKTQPETTFAKEISDRVRVIACLDKMPNIVHSDMEGETFSSTEWQKLKSFVKAGEKDVLVVVWGNIEDVQTASEEIAIRAKEAIEGIPNETRRPLPNGTNEFERILPGPNRMYPDTDLPPLAITEERIRRITSNIPEQIWVTERRYMKMGLSRELASQLVVARERELFERAAKETRIKPKRLASIILHDLRRMRKEGLLVNFSDERFISTLREIEKNSVVEESIPMIVKRTCGKEKLEPSKAILEYKPITKKELREEIAKIVGDMNLPAISRDKLHGYLMGKVMEKFRGRVRGREVSKIVSSILRAK